MKCVITGGAGFIGSQLADYLLARENDVLVFDNLSWGKKSYIKHNLNHPRYKFVHIDVRHYQSLLEHLPTETDTIFHLAANSDISRSSLDPEIDLQHTVFTTFNILNAMKQKKIKKIFYTSGSGVYGDVGDYKTSESFGPLFPVSMYGATKLSAEAIISAYVHLFELQAFIVRPANIIGPRATHGVVYDFVKRLKNNPRDLTILGDGNQSKSYLYVSDVLDAFYRIWTKSSEPINLYNLANDDFITVNEIAETIISEMKLEKVHITHTGGKVGWKGDIPVVRLDNKKIKKLGWKFKYNTKSAVSETVKALI